MEPAGRCDLDEWSELGSRDIDGKAERPNERGRKSQARRVSEGAERIKVEDGEVKQTFNVQLLEKDQRSELDVAGLALTLREGSFTMNA